MSEQIANRLEGGALAQQMEGVRMAQAMDASGGKGQATAFIAGLKRIVDGRRLQRTHWRADPQKELAPAKVVEGQCQDVTSAQAIGGDQKEDRVVAQAHGCGAI